MRDQFGTIAGPTWYETGPIWYETGPSWYESGPISGVSGTFLVPFGPFGNGGLSGGNFRQASIPIFFSVRRAY
ncbi:MAG: hypothetical protein NT013_19910 [Planctomycetia bacterium]|nr:hypothetical protein [Planctomycetia bacterium]